MSRETTEGGTTPFDVVLEQRGADLWVCPQGDLDLSGAPEFSEALSLARRSDAESIIVDLRDLEFLDSTGLGVLVRACSSPDGARIQLIEGPPAVMQVLRVSGLDRELPLRPAP
ncbi:MAG TPA: STAS domain-containing protein [Baekduia sp.]|nr:STAS domain-containing protein [Baekduia sp.]